MNVILQQNVSVKDIWNVMLLKDVLLNLAQGLTCATLMMIVKGLGT